jgi:2'-hydroxyisoflavone reductase
VDVLVLGGSVFLGRVVANQAVGAGHRVTVFNRGRSGPTPYGAEALVGDRTVDLSPLRGRSFDVVVDTSGYVPTDVARSAREVDCGHYVFISSISAYPGWPEEVDSQPTYDGDPNADGPPAGLDPAAAYGWLKVGCERAVRLARGDTATILRAGCIVGPDDSQVGRLPWWLARAARGGEVLTPGAPEDPISLIDARDLADFALAAIAGTFDVGGPSGRDTRQDLMAACRTVTGSDADFVYVGDDWLAAQGVVPWTQIPLWVPHAPGLFRRDVRAAEARGMRCRSLLETVRDTWAWQSARPQGWRPTERTPGLADAEEAAVMAIWHEEAHARSGGPLGPA